VACWHAAARYSKRRAGPSFRAAGFIAGWSCGLRMNRSSPQLVSHCSFTGADAHGRRSGRLFTVERRYQCAYRLDATNTNTIDLFDLQAWPGLSAFRDNRARFENVWIDLTMKKVQIVSLNPIRTAVSHYYVMLPSDMHLLCQTLEKTASHVPCESQTFLIWLSWWETLECASRASYVGTESAWTRWWTPSLICSDSDFLR
jgi:hypothetical protein